MPDLIDEPDEVPDGMVIEELTCHVCNRTEAVLLNEHAVIIDVNRTGMTLGDRDEAFVLCPDCNLEHSGMHRWDWWYTMPVGGGDEFDDGGF